MACTSMGVQAAGVSNVATYSHLLGSSTFNSFSVLPHLTETCTEALGHLENSDSFFYNVENLCQASTCTL